MMSEKFRLKHNIYPAFKSKRCNMLDPSDLPTSFFQKILNIYKNIWKFKIMNWNKDLILFFDLKNPSSSWKLNQKSQLKRSNCVKKKQIDYPYLTFFKQSNTFPFTQKKPVKGVSHLAKMSLNRLNIYNFFIFVINLKEKIWTRDCFCNLKNCLQLKRQDNILCHWKPI